jgi:putative membrane-bound dehydrogenase-like protein
MFCALFTFVIFLSLTLCAAAADTAVPHGQQKPPGPALSPAEAIAKMKVPEGFSVELVASEPEIVNPVAMTFDERGRIWITESLEYPRREPGPGRDRVKVLEDTDGDGRADRFTVFMDGLNIPSGIAVGAGGVWVANSPDILFVEDTDGDGRADRQEVVVTGFGRADTHELPNSLTWGPDGWLYGLNGVFNPSQVEHRGKKYDFTCALFRIHPRTREFELFAEGTSNPWGVAFDRDGSAFVSACVIDHLWHLTETGYYHRQGGPYPPFTWKLDSIVKHRHQQAAYCGIHYFDSAAYPERFREKLYMGNIHGNAINCDSLERDGSTYFATPHDDFLSANDAWFMPVVQKTGPDGCLYILDWYDRYHCYQDANRDPKGIDRLKGRLYRVRYQNTPRAGSFDLAQESDDRLIQRLHSPNVFFRDLAQRLLWERADPKTLDKLQRLVLDEGESRKARMHALWSLIGAGPLQATFHQELLAHADATFRAWGVRAAGN